MFFIDCKIRNRKRIFKEEVISGGGHLYKRKSIIYGKTSVLTRTNKQLTKDYEDAIQVQADWMGSGTVW